MRGDCARRQESRFHFRCEIRHRLFVLPPGRRRRLVGSRNGAHGRRQFGFQIGASETDVIMLVMNHSGRNHLLSSQFTLGGDASVAAGPVGRTSSAETDAQMSAEILSWSRSKGLFAGISLTGATLRQDLDDNNALYGRRLDNKEIVKDGSIHGPASAKRLHEMLVGYSDTREHKGDNN